METSCNKLPNWDRDAKKLSNHYKLECIQTFIEHIHKTEKKTQSEDPNFTGFVSAHYTEFTMFLALNMGIYPRKISEVPRPIKKWCKRVFLLAIHPQAWNACKTGVISSRFALDMMDYVHNPIYEQAIKDAVEGKIDNKTFRTHITLSKEKHKNVRHRND